MRGFWFAAFLGCVLALSGCVTGSAPPDLEGLSARERFEQISGRGREKALEEYIEDRRVPGVSVAVIQDFQIRWAKGYGVADVNSGESVSTQTLFQAASISKPVAAMAAVRAAQDGAFGLDDDINSLLKSWQLTQNDLTAKKNVTPRGLLSHTAGTTVHGFPGYHPDAGIPTVPQLLSGEAPANTDAVVVDVEPGSIWRYSGGGTTIMQLALSDVLGEPFPTAAKRLVLEPAGMRSSRYEQPLAAEADRIAARAHDGRGQAMDAKWHVYPELQAAGLWTTPTDLCRFAIAVMDAQRGASEAVISQESARLMLTPVAPGRFGLGLSISNRDDGVWAGHGGSNWGFRCDLAFNVDKGFGYCIMTNGESGSVVINELRRRLFAAYGWSSPDD